MNTDTFTGSNVLPYPKVDPLVETGYTTLLPEKITEMLHKHFSDENGKFAKRVAIRKSSLEKSGGATTRLVNFDNFKHHFDSLQYYVANPKPYDHASFVGRMSYVMRFFAEPQQRCITKLVNTLQSLYNARDWKAKPTQIQHLVGVLSLQFYHADKLFRNHSVASQHYWFDVKDLRTQCEFVKDGVHKVCTVHVVPPSDRSPPPPYLEDKQLEPLEKKRRLDTSVTSAPIHGLVERHGAFGTFANYEEYERYVALLANRRTADARAMAAGLAAGAHVYNSRDPFPFGYCKLLLFNPDNWAEIFQRGKDALTKEDLINYAKYIRSDTDIMFIIDTNTNQAHLSMERQPPAGAGLFGVKTKVKHLVAELTKAFADGVCDYDELEDIYYHITPTQPN